MTPMFDPGHIWNLIYNARSNRCHHPTSPNTAPATQNDSHAWSSLHMKRHLQCAEQQVSPSNLTKYCACHEKWLDCFIVLTYETSFPMRGATGVTIQPRQILRLPRKMTLQDVKENLQKQVKRHFQCGADPTMIRAWSENENANRNPPRKWGYFARSPEAFSIVKYNVLHPILQSNFHQILRLPRKVTLQLHQVLRLPRKVPLERHQVLHLPRKVTLELHQVVHLPRKVTLELHQVLRLSRRKTHILSPHRIWNVIYSARSNRCHHPTSPNTAPATKNDSTALSSSHMKRHFQCAEQQVSLSNLTKYCACHEKWHCKISKKISKNRWNVISNAGPIRPWSDHDPTMIREWSENENANRNPPRKWGYFARSPEAFSIVKYNVLHPILQSNFHQILRLPRKVPLERHQVLRLPRKVTLELHQVLRLPRKVTLELHQVLRLPRKVTLELHQVLHLPRKVTLELGQVLRLPLYCNWTLLYSTLLDTTLLDSTLLDTILLDSNLLDSTLLDSTLLDLLYMILLYLTYSTWLYSTWHYSIWLYSTWHCSTWLYSTWLYSTWLYSTWLYSTSYYSTWLYSTWLYSTWPTLLDSTLLDLLYLTLLYLTLLYLTLLYLTLFYLTLLYLTLLYLTLLYLTLLYLTLLYFTLFYLTLLYLTLLYLTLLYLTKYLTLLYLTLLYLTLLYSTLLYLT